MRKFWTFLRLLNQPCRDMASLMSRALDGNLTPTERFAINLHMLYCTACRRYNKQLGFMRRILEHTGSAALDGWTDESVTLSPQAREKLQAALKDQ